MLDRLTSGLRGLRTIIGDFARLPETLPGDITNPRLPAPLLLAAAACGAVPAMVAPEAQRGVEGAQVLAGLVVYPPEAPMGQYYLGMWTAVHQIGALAVNLGFGPVDLDRLFGAMAGAAIVAAFAMVIHAFTREARFSLGLALIAAITGFASNYFASPDYPLFGSTLLQLGGGTFGVLAGALSAFAIASVAGRRCLLAGLTAGILVAIHAAVGSYVVALMAATILVDRLLHLDLPMRGAVQGLLIGLSIAAVSFLMFFVSRPPAGEIDQAAFDLYLALWDGHRNRTPGLWHVTAVIVSIAALFGLIAPRLRRRTGSGDPRSAFAWMMAISMVTSGLLYLGAHLAPALVPAIVMRAIPGRLLNVHALLAGATVIGVATAFLTSREMVARYPAAWQGLRARFPARLATLGDQAGSLPPLTVVAICLIGLNTPYLAANSVRWIRDIAVSAMQSAAAADEARFWSEVRAGRIGRMVLVAGEANILAVREGHLAVALDTTAFDFVPYLPQTAGAVRRIVEAGYGVPFGDPPVRFRGALIGEAERPYWAGLTPQQWRDLGKAIDVGAVIAPRDWTIGLPATVAGARYSLYRIPDGGP